MSLGTSGLYRITCGAVGIGETGRTVEGSVKEHRRVFQFYHPERSEVAQHATNQGHRIHYVKQLHGANRNIRETPNQPLSLCLTKHQATKTNGGSGCIAPRSLNLCT
jgi:hypothetical protein